MFPVLSANTLSTGYNINNSLRFRSSASAYLSRTPASAGNRRTWTWSGWVKRGNIGGLVNMLFFVRGSDTDSTYLRFGFDFAVTNCFSITNFNSTLNLTTTQVFRDPSAWYHIVVAMDTTQATASNRLKLYVNGAQVTAFSTANYPTQNTDYGINNSTSTIIGAAIETANYYFDGYMTEINFIDGQALTPSSFGSTNATTGVWQPARYTGTYGTNGFYLKFNNTSSVANLGLDSSGNGNTWTVNNVSLTAGSTYDAMIDSPTLTSATVANYAVLNPLITGNVVTPTNANLTSSVSAGTNAYFSSAGTIAVSSGKWYWECSITARDAGAGQWFQFGIVSSTTTYTNNAIGYSGNMSNAYAYYNDGSKAGNGTGTAGYGATFTTSDIIGIAFDADAGTITFYKNNVSQGQAFSGISSSLSWLPIIQIYGSTGAANTAAINFGQRPFSYTPPTGFVRLNTFNLPDSTIVKGNTVMDATLYTGNLTGQSITNAAAFKPDLVWIKSRSAATDNKLTDSVRGATLALVSNSSAAETTDLTGLTAFNSNGFTLGASTTYNNTGATYVGWQWQAGQSSGSSNTSGTITSTVSVNTTAGFSVVTFTANGVTGATVGHGLGVAPKFMIVRARNTAQGIWPVYHASIGNTGYLALNTTAATTTNIGMWNNTSPTSTVFTIGDPGFLWGSGFTYVAYCWSEIAGFSRFGSYTGNGSTDGPFVYTGFRPKFIMYKRTDATQSWILMDTSRSPYNVADKFLGANFADSEYTGTILDMLSNGFKVREAGTQTNANGGTYIYMAFAENPFKNVLAR